MRNKDLNSLKMKEKTNGQVQVHSFLPRESTFYSKNPKQTVLQIFHEGCLSGWSAFNRWVLVMFWVLSLTLYVCCRWLFSMSVGRSQNL